VLGDLKRARDQEIAKISAQKKAKLAEQLFTELISLRSNKKNAVQLTQTLYLSLRNRFMELATEGTETINLREFVGPARLDANLVRKLDRDQSGTLEFSEVLKATFPSMLQKNLNALSRKWDFELRDETQQESAISVLSAESKAMAMAMFRLCDAQGKGVVSKDDMARHFVPADWDPSEPLWFERYFPNASAVVSFEEFVEMIKFCFPPFRHGTGYAQVLSRAESVKGESVKPWRLPADVIEAQDRAKACE
jgi:Ca2+-binding EF-hand superfamily protein